MTHFKMIRLFAPATLGALTLLSAATAFANSAVMYTSNNIQVIDTATDIAKKTAPGLNIQKVTSGTGALMKRIEAEAKNPLGDVVWGAGFGTMAAFRQNFQPYASAQAKDIPAQFKGPDHLWVGSNAHVMILMVNNKQLKGATAPKAGRTCLPQLGKTRSLWAIPPPPVAPTIRYTVFINCSALTG